jgi:hypothetical protein
MIGTRIGGWVLEAEIGRGPMGTVYRGRHPDPRDDAPAVAAVKVLTHPLAVAPAFVARFPGEMLGLRRLTHPNLARFYDSGVHAGLPFYACELADGTDAAALVARGGLPWQTTVFGVAVQAARALKHAHHRSTLHRGLKPADVVIAADGAVKLTDFGAAKVLGQPPLSLPPDPMGTAAYLAPEHFTGKPLTRRSDLYALGGVLYTLATGRPPFAASGTAELMHKHCYVLPERPIQFVPRLPPDFDELICSLLAKDPNRRPASAAAVLEELDRIRGKAERRGERVFFPPAPDDPTGTHAPLAAAAEPSAAGADRRRLWQAAGLGAALLAVVGVMLWVFFRPRPSADSLLAAALPLVESDDPADWDRAVDEYLEPLSRWHPGERADVVRAARRRVRERKDLRQAVAAGANARYSSDAERTYHRGLALARAGDLAAARLTWAAVAAAFAADPDARHWVELARAGLAELDRHPGGPPPTAGLAAALDEVRKRRSAGRTAAADDILRAIELLYRDQPDAQELIRRGR